MNLTTLLIALVLPAPVFAAGTALPTADEARIARPDIANTVANLVPTRNRAGQLYIPGQWTSTPEAQALLLERFLSRADSVELRVALAYSLDDSHLFSWDEIQSEAAAEVRAAMLHHVKAERSLAGSALLANALSDSSEWVRSEAARLAGYLPVESTLQQALLDSLADSHAKTRALSARSLGWHKVEIAYDPILELLSDSDPEVVDTALRALSTLDRERTRDLPEIRGLTESPYPRIAARAAALLED